MIETSLLRTATGNRAIPLRGVKVSGEVYGGHGVFRVEQRYVNEEKKPGRGGVRVPAAVRRDADRLLHAVRRAEASPGVVKEREAAFRDYDDALTRGHGAALLDQERPNVFTAQVGNLLPGRGDRRGGGVRPAAPRRRGIAPGRGPHPRRAALHPGRPHGRPHRSGLGGPDGPGARRRPDHPAPRGGRLRAHARPPAGPRHRARGDEPVARRGGDFRGGRRPRAVRAGGRGPRPRRGPRRARRRGPRPVHHPRGRTGRGARRGPSRSPWSPTSSTAAPARRWTWCSWWTSRARWAARRSSRPARPSGSASGSCGQGDRFGIIAFSDRHADLPPEPRALHPGVARRGRRLGRRPSRPTGGPRCSPPWSAPWTSRATGSSSSSPTARWGTSRRSSTGSSPGGRAAGSSPSASART